MNTGNTSIFDVAEFECVTPAAELSFDLAGGKAAHEAPQRIAILVCYAAAQDVVKTFEGGLESDESDFTARNVGGTEGVTDQVTSQGFDFVACPGFRYGKIAFPATPDSITVMRYNQRKKGCSMGLQGGSLLTVTNPCSKAAECPEPVVE